jgi:hypothetical protein
VRAGEDTTPGNKVSAMFTSLATNVDDPLERIRQIRETTLGAKEEHKAVGANMLQEWAEYAGPNTFNLASRLYSSLGLAASHRPIHNVIISNVPGPPFKLYYGGAEMVAAYPMGPAMEGVGLNITVFSYQDSIDFGFMADRELVPDVWDMADLVPKALDELRAAAGLPPSAARHSAPGDEGPTATAPPAKKAPARKTAARKAPTRKAAAKRASAKTAPAEKAPAKKAPAKKASARKVAARKEPTRKVTAKKAAARKTAGKKASARKAPARN